MKIRQCLALIMRLIDKQQELKNIELEGTLTSIKHYDFCSYLSITDGLSQEDIMDCGLIPKVFPKVKTLQIGDSIKCTGNIRVNAKMKKINYMISKCEISKNKVNSSYELILKRITEEGLCDIPQKSVENMHTSIGIITSLNAAALKDSLHIFTQNMLFGCVHIFDSVIQGDSAPDDIMHWINDINKNKSCDIILITRGGGAKDDFNCLNNYELAKCIKLSEIPIASGIGHEIDRTIIDDVADCSFITPTEAATELTDWHSQIINQQNNVQKEYNSLSQNIISKYEKYKTIFTSGEKLIHNDMTMKLMIHINEYNQCITNIFDKYVQWKRKLDSLKNNMTIKKYNSILHDIINKYMIYRKNFEKDNIKDHYLGLKSQCEKCDYSINYIKNHTEQKYNELKESYSKIVQPHIFINTKEILTKDELKKTKKITIHFIDGDVEVQIL